MSLKPTPEQDLILSAARDSADNLQIRALAGSGKTSTLVMLANELCTKPILSIAFNKRIADEMGKRLPSHVKSATVNSVGHGACMKLLGRGLRVETKKSYNTLKAIVDALPRAQRFSLDFSDTLNAVRQAKIQGYIPDGLYPQATHMVAADDFYGDLEEDVDRGVVDEILHRSIQAAYRGEIDYDDQIYMSVLFNAPFPEFPIVMIDESQDLSPMNHALLARLARSARLIAVGDPFQSIYAFRGADSASMDRLQAQYAMRVLDLSISFRCPQAIVERARFRAPHMQWAEGAEMGSVRSPDGWAMEDIPDGAAIICRNNAPLFKLALRLLSKGRGVNLVGTDLGPALTRTLKKMGPETMRQDALIRAIDEWQAERIAKKKNKEAALIDKADCLRVFAGFGPTLGAALAYADHLFKAQGPVQLLSGHKSKGLEWDTVFHLDPWRVPSRYAKTHEEREQELNVRYVIETRSRRDLWLVNNDELAGYARATEEDAA